MTVFGRGEEGKLREWNGSHHLRTYYLPLPYQFKQPLIPTNILHLGIIITNFTCLISPNRQTCNDHEPVWTQTFQESSCMIMVETRSWGSTTGSIYVLNAFEAPTICPG